MRFRVPAQEPPVCPHYGEDGKMAPPVPTWNIALGLNASGEVSVLGDGMAVVIQWGELGRDLGVARHQHWR